MSKYFTEEQNKEMREIADYLFTHYRHRHTEHGVDVMLNKAIESKGELLELLSKMPGYNGNGQVVIDHLMPRENVPWQVYSFVDEFGKKIDARRKIVKNRNKDGKTMMDIIREENMGQPTCIKVNKINKVAFRKRDKSDEFSYNGEIADTVKKYERFLDSMDVMARNYMPTVSGDTANRMNNIVSNIRAAEGQKTSRLFNKACDYFGVADQKSGSSYQREFATYSNLVSGTQRQMKFIISVNPIDFLTMSFGKSWASCHTIDKLNLRRAPGHYSGAYCGGTLSYMLDKVTFITYVVPAGHYNDGKILLPNHAPSEELWFKDHPELMDKTYRNVYHWNGNGGLIQGRIYPQGNDGSTDLYKEFRMVVEKQICEALGLANSWSKPSRDYLSHVTTDGAHYPDYSRYSDCCGVLLKGIDDANFNMSIGHAGICPYCGEDIMISSRISHEDCTI